MNKQSIDVHLVAHTFNYDKYLDDAFRFVLSVDDLCTAHKLRFQCAEMQ